jgi:Integrase core domain
LSLCDLLAHNLITHQEPRRRRKWLLLRKRNGRFPGDITKLLGPAKWTYFYLYVMLDVFSRYVVGWMVAHRESATLAEKFSARRAPARGSVGTRLLAHLQAAEFLYETSLFHDLEYTFKHALTHEVAYSTLLRRSRPSSSRRVPKPESRSRSSPSLGRRSSPRTRRTRTLTPTSMPTSRCSGT